MTNFNVRSKHKFFGALYSYSKKKSILRKNLLLFNSRKTQNLKYQITKMLSEYALNQLHKQKFDLQAKNLVRKMLLRKTFASLKNRLILNLLGE